VTSCRIRQIYYKPAQIGLLDEKWVPYYNDSGVTPFFENRVFRELYLRGDHGQSDYYGIFSPKFFNKHRKDGKIINRLMSLDNYNHDVYSFFGGKQLDHSKQVNTFFDTYHPHLLEIGCKLIKTLFGEDLTTIKADRIYYNHWIAKSEIFESYCKEMLLPAMDLLDGELRGLTWEDSKYKEGYNMNLEVAAIMSEQQCIDAWGKPYYPHHAFVLERLPSIYFALKEYKIKQL